MSAPTRVTGPLLDVLTVFLIALDEGTELHGWAIAQASGRLAPTVYGVLDRLEDARWITGEWETHDDASSRRRRRLYRLTSDGALEARKLLTERQRPLPGRATATRSSSLSPGLSTS
jgi:DNA-binding PadR family transcriptional regulator